MNTPSNPIQELVTLFATHLADLRFGDIDAQSLSKAAQAVESAAEEVAAIEARLTEARKQLRDAEDALHQQGQRALAYARVYAESDAALGARLEAIALRRATRRGRTEASSSSNGIEVTTESQRRPRGRPRKTPLAPAPDLPEAAG